jgi:hypothetical protein
MKSHRWMGIGIVAASLLGSFLVWNQASHGQAQAVRPPVVWEYKAEWWGGGDPQPTLNGLGKQGWELVAVRGYGNEPQSHTLYVFKRAKP